MAIRRIQGDSHIYSNVNLGAILNIEIRNNSRLASGGLSGDSNGNRDSNIEFGVRSTILLTQAEQHRQSAAPQPGFLGAPWRLAVISF